ncbi:hypothetical protein PR003_g28929 [Phytophthora rubi]|uniref:Uncharacterized protein n=1 Tax=Phytophthora rubi TaxID=129364 RepID=A0A6A4BR52_9STRA|nr:hypothetical protein PR003_g28929 [Phytophthora rubi]
MRGVGASAGVGGRVGGATGGVGASAGVGGGVSGGANGVLVPVLARRVFSGCESIVHGCIVDQ